MKMVCKISPEKVTDDALRQMIEDTVNDHQSGMLFDKWMDVIENNGQPDALESAAIIALSKEKGWSLRRAYLEVKENGAHIHMKTSACLEFKYGGCDYVVMTR